MPRRRVPITIGVIVLILVLAGGGFLVFRSYTTSSASLLHPVPWKAGQRLTPLITTSDPTLISYATARVIEERMQTSLPLTDPRGATYASSYSFDPDKHRFVTGEDIPAGRIAGVTATQGSSNAELANGTSTITIFDQSAHRDAALLADRARGEEYKSVVLGTPSVLGVEDVSLAHWAGSCTSAHGRSDSIIATGKVDARTEIAASYSCVDPSDVPRRKEQVVTLLGQLATIAAGLAETPLPAKLFDQTDHYPILSSGMWDDAQITIPTDATAQQLKVLPEQLRQPGVRMLYVASDRVVVTDDASVADRLLDNAPAWKIEPSSPAPQSRTAPYADRQTCLPGDHPNERERCLTRIGRFVIISIGRYPEEQARLLSTVK